MFIDQNVTPQIRKKNHVVFLKKLCPKPHLLGLVARGGELFETRSGAIRAWIHLPHGLRRGRGAK